ncbi:MAG: ATP-binding protein [Calditerrivibrio sp.]|nr:ATP-binding protein [Calditerrivibrio sp.]MCA1980858.1 ATP-binding protein [Calditerrivibrio sp.]
MKKLPIGIQTFEKIRDKQENYIYVDKTKYALDLIQSGVYYFLSRPRRFGKSLFLSTLKAIFEGKKEYFEGLYIYDRWDWEEKYPVIHLSFAESDLTTKDLILKTVKSIFQLNQHRLGIECMEQDYMHLCFKELILKAYEKYNKKVVILVDEYDKLILDNIENTEMAKFAREELRRIYSVMKDADPYIKFVFLTGVSKFSKTSIFSGLNNLKDISLDSRYATICGYTQREFETSFAEYFEGVDLDEVKEWYNGYYWGVESVYNPFDILLFLDNPEKSFKNYWFETGTPTFLMKLIENNNYFLPNLSNLVVDESLLGSFDIDNMRLEVILFQTGYLTIDKVETTPFGSINYILRLPNKEVKISFNNFIIDRLIGDSDHSKKKIELYKSLFSKEMEAFKSTITSLFASIPYNNYVNNEMQKSEGFYATVIYVYLQSLGVDIVGEDVTNRGRIDITVKFPNSIYIMEIKVTDEDPLAQIKLKKYYEKYLNEGKDIYLVGMKFDRNEKNLVEFVWEKV